MTIDEAIKVGERFTQEGDVVTSKELLDFSKLGIEALKREKFRREHYGWVVGQILPGETK